MNHIDQYYNYNYIGLLNRISFRVLLSYVRLQRATVEEKL